IAVDASGAAYVTGETNSTDFPTTAGAYQTTNPNFSAVVSKVNPSGSALEYSTFLGGSDGAGGGGIAVDRSGAAYVAGVAIGGIAVDSSGIAWITGETNSSNFPTTAGAFQTADAGEADAFATKLASDGSGVYSTYLGGQCDDVGRAIAVDPVGAAYVTGTSTPA